MPTGRAEQRESAEPEYWVGDILAWTISKVRAGPLVSAPSRLREMQFASTRPLTQMVESARPPTSSLVL